ncbi:asparaginase [Paraoerskovia sediminicola]|uniref:Asparaginase n=1 Tax=Paraoerskovia sediminicola TaxID=1138587 RepID=A0ABM8G3F8_9CELL|nr:asparaginase [Paraoerskovia sediminicola]BDZ42570.1 asparaginase [Paraoerskovia sediminicola]
MPPATTVADGAVPLAEVVRGDLVESTHLGHLVVLDADDAPRLALGRPDVVIWPRSCVKPVQATVMVRAGLDLPPRLLALAAASHDGTAEHVDGAREILAIAGLDEQALRSTPDVPLDPEAAATWRASGGGPDRITQNCSGKHAAMLLTCQVNGWSLDDYLDPTHPLQQAIAATLRELTGDPDGLPVSTDGCGAPLFSTTLSGLARALGRVAGAPRRDPDSAEATVARAMSAHPRMVAGARREGTRVMQAIPGVVAKDGADGVFAVGLPDGGSIAFKVLDGAGLPRPAIVVAALRAAGYDDPALDPIGRTPVLGGGVEVGSVRALLPADLRSDR